jgi:hypothetical protein
MNDLNERLAHEADGFFRRGGSTLELDQVLERAGEIRRGRRMRATMLMAACVLAIAVPTVLVAADRDRTTPPSPAGQARVDDSALTLGDLHVGDTPHGAFSWDGTWQLDVAANGLGGLKGRVVAAAAMKDGAMVAMARPSGETRAYFVYSQGGTSEKSWPMANASRFAVSDGGNVAAFVEPGGTVVAVQDRGDRYAELGNVPQGSGFLAVGVQGEDCSAGSAAGTCQVYVATTGVDPKTYVLQPPAAAKALDPALDRTVDVKSERYAGYSSTTDTGSCSAVRTADLTSLWKTCDHRLLSFSPDGTHVLASGAYADGMGDSELAVLDAKTGKVALDLRTATEGVLTQMVWEDDSHVLAVMFQQGRWAVLRIGLDGSREYAVEPVDASDDTQSPFVLPTR